MSSSLLLPLSVSVGCCFYGNIAFWVTSAIYAATDYLAQSKWSGANEIRKRKLQPVFLTRQEYRDVFLVALLNMVVISPVIGCPLFEWMWNGWNPPGIRLQESDEWQWQRELIRLPIFALAVELTFYWTHWILHASPLLYQHIHKQHHRFKAPCSMAAVYAHPLEFIFGNALGIALGPILTNSHPYTAYAWFAIALFNTCKGHSGYDFWGAKIHDDHHKFTNYNFGVLNLCDFLMGTTYHEKNKTVKEMS